MTALKTLAVSIVIPSYARSGPIVRLLTQLGAQTLSPERFEVIVVDDGSPTPLAELLGPLVVPYALTVVRQDNAGAAAARHYGATRAQSPWLVFLDDDMQVPSTLLEAHLAVHESTPRAVVVGHIRAAHAIADMPIFERYHARQLEAHVADLRATGRSPCGAEVCTGNLSMARAEYFAVGGFDTSLARSEDAELGVRLEKAGRAPLLLRRCVQHP